MHEVTRTRTGTLSGTGDFEVQLRLFRDEGGNERVRAEVSLLTGQGRLIAGAADVVPYPPNPSMSVIPHQANLKNKGAVLSISSTLVGVIGPAVGGCLGVGQEQARFQVLSCITSKMDDMLDKAFAAVQEQLEAVGELE